MTQSLRRTLVRDRRGDSEALALLRGVLVRRVVGRNGRTFRNRIPALLGSDGIAAAAAAAAAGVSSALQSPPMATPAAMRALRALGAVGEALEAAMAPEHAAVSPGLARDLIEHAHPDDLARLARALPPRALRAFTTPRLVEQFLGDPDAPQVRAWALETLVPRMRPPAGPAR